jgi:hypothetical protein
MHSFKKTAVYISIGAAFVGGFYGIASAVWTLGQSVLFWEIGICLVSGVALIAAGASTLYRTYTMLKLVRQIGHQPTNHELCYRGIRYSPRPEATANQTDVGEVDVDDDGVIASLESELPGDAVDRATDFVPSVNQKTIELVVCEWTKSETTPKIISRKQVSIERFRKSLERLVQDSDIC